VAEAIPAGNLRALLGMLDDPAAREADAQGHRAAQATVRQLDARLARLSGGGELRGETALRLGQESAAVIGLAALVAGIVAAALG
jgi:TPP-dependent pyruvate/acetoin dehydrogenase alpha subunit